MIVIVCVDDKGGMMFHKRRQSQDRILRERMVRLTEGKQIWMSEDSFRQFEKERQSVIRTDPKFYQKAGLGEFCFVEDPAFIGAEEAIEQVVRYCWNRAYPADAYFPLSLSGWRLVFSEDFAGYSHEKITEEIYVR